MSVSGFSLSVLLAVFYFSACGEAAIIPRHRKEISKTCGYQSCPVPDPNKLNIHLVAHTHDDVGWLKTVDQYYFGSKSNIQKAGVQYILDSVIQALLADPERRFIYVETAFFWKWWLRQSEQRKEDVRTLIEEGRLEIIGGAWSMNDEATTHYHSIIDQFTWGFRRLNDTFGSCARPHIGWQIDPFGHSRGQASLFAQMGFDGMFLGRLDYQDKSRRLADKNMEFIWKASPSLGKQADLFTVAMFNTYSPPPGFCFDVLCQDEPIIDDPKSADYNVNERIDTFLRYAANQATYYRTNNVILTMGGDFTYQQAEMYFINLDRLIRHVTERNGFTVNVFYSTPSCYLKAVHDAHKSWPNKTDDFFPYASDPHAYWTGYFSSRPSIKYFERMGNNLLQISKQLSALTDLQNYDEQLEYFREVMGVMQHHDAVTGTEKQLVAEDYARLLHESMQQGENIASESLRKWSTKENRRHNKRWSTKKDDALPEVSNEMYSCMQLNISSCPYTEEHKSFVLSVYNPLSRESTTHVRLPVQGNSYTVTDLSDRNEIVSQILPIPTSILNTPGRVSKATLELVFSVTLPPLGYKTYAVVENESAAHVEPDIVNFIGNEFYNVSVNDDGQINVNWKKYDDKSFVQSFHYYEGTEGDNKVFETRASGAYIFRPKNISTNNFVYSGSYKIYKGPVVEEIHQTINSWVSQVIRVYKEAEHIEFDWLVGPIPVDDAIGKEIVTKYTSNLKSKNEFYTDSNGREMLKRKLNYRPTWDLILKEAVAGNYYPITNKISIKDEDAWFKLSVLTDRSQGGSSMQEGEMELMLHRRLLKDDAFGVGEALNETAFGQGLVVRGSHYVFGGSTRNVDAFVLKEKKLTLEVALRPWTFVSPMSRESVERWGNTNNLQASGLAKALPRNVHILTLEPWKDGTILLRLEHIFEVGEASQLSHPVEVNIQDLFTTFKIVSMEETTLGGNQWKKDLNRMQWKSETKNVLHEQEDTVSSIDLKENIINVLLKPMEIRTFILTVTPRKF